MREKLCFIQSHDHVVFVCCIGGACGGRGHGVASRVRDGEHAAHLPDPAGPEGARVPVGSVCSGCQASQPDRQLHPRAPHRAQRP